MSPTLDLLGSVAGVLASAVFLGCALFLLAGAWLAHYRPKPDAEPNIALKRLAGGMVLIAGGLHLGYEKGASGLYALWLKTQVPDHVWVEPPMAVAGPQARIGGAAVSVRSFQGEYELYARDVLVRRNGADLAVTAGELEVLKRRAGTPGATTKVVYARIYRGHVRSGVDGRGRRWSAVDFEDVADSIPVGKSMPLSDGMPFATLGATTFTFRNAAIHCETECYVGFVLELQPAAGERSHARTTGILLRAR